MSNYILSLNVHKSRENINLTTEHKNKGSERLLLCREGKGNTTTTKELILSRQQKELNKEDRKTIMNTLNANNKKTKPR
ncbi:hypothetical protein E2C01_088923 [Portunus trituberculatus]|uniref:Uncharacterized protein n=1 Tax=Portunus trituberculatus TaxID=210409 RepID=A0A5B7JC48_PORTR|nr:hypothetical protein [Portunus trituberculatus]